MRTSFAAPSTRTVNSPTRARTQGIDLLSLVLPAVCERHPHVRVLVGGDGPKRQLLEKVRMPRCMCMCKGYLTQTLRWPARRLGRKDVSGRGHRPDSWPHFRWPT